MTFSKAWTERADRDLFYTILEIKNVSIISGSEWSEVGAVMRALGYKFTNEGCRQHFQGIRRSRKKVEEDGAGSTSTLASPIKPEHNTGTSSATVTVDPRFNPIARRPGPGRGRPKKRPASETSTAAPSGQGHVQAPATSPLDGKAGAHFFKVEDPALQSSGGYSPSVAETPVVQTTPQSPLASITSELQTPMESRPPGLMQQQQQQQHHLASVAPDANVQSYHPQHHPQHHHAQPPPSLHHHHQHQPHHTQPSPLLHHDQRHHLHMGPFPPSMEVRHPPAIQLQHIPQDAGAIQPPPKRPRTHVKMEDDGLDDEAVLSLVAADPPSGSVGNYPAE